jgi:hypothetical protein
MEECSCISMEHRSQHFIKVNDQLHAWTAMSPGKQFSVIGEQVVGSCAQTQSECCREENASPWRESNPNPTIVRPTAQSLHHFSYAGPYSNPNSKCTYYTIHLIYKSLQITYSDIRLCITKSALGKAV